MNFDRHLPRWLFFGCLVFMGIGRPAFALDLTKAVVVIPDDLSHQEKKAVEMLVDEVFQRTGIHWEIKPDWPIGSGSTAIAVGRESGLLAKHAPIASWLDGLATPVGKEGYRIKLEGQTILVVGTDVRGVLFGVGRLLRELRMSPAHIGIDSNFQVSTAPQTALRGHQLGYRPKTNSYDGWDLVQWERYIRDLAVFGTNAIELVPPRTDDDDESPHFPRPPMDTMVGMSRLADDYGLDVWIWYPAMDKDYSNPATVESALSESEKIFKALPRIDAIFVPGGDPGHTRPIILMAFLEKQAELLRRHHPKAQMWVSPQSFNKEWHDEFLSIVGKKPPWLTGLVHGPQVRVSLEDLRATIPSRYPIRNYPDITHTINCQYPVPDWDLAFALTYDREPINPRPLGQAAIFRSAQKDSVGFLTYSEGCNDDVNKFVWSGLGWDASVPVVDILRQYSRYFIGDHYTDSFAQGLLALERNWKGPLLTNRGVETTLGQFQDIEHSASPQNLLNWRFQQALYRAYYDAYVHDRLIQETAIESEARAVLRTARSRGSLRAMAGAEAVFDRALTSPVSVDRRQRVGELAEALFQSIHMQLSKEKYKAIQIGRGTTLDSVDAPINDRAWFEAQFTAIRKQERESDRLKSIDALLRRTDPGPGGFYDNLGDATQQSHLVRGADFATSPDFRKSWVIGFDDRPGSRPMAWSRNVQSLYDAPLQMHYDGLDPTATYRLKVVYGGDNFKPLIRLNAEGLEIHPLIKKPEPLQPIEFDLPISLTSDGKLDLRWNQESGRGGNGRGCQISEVWLMKR